MALARRGIMNLLQNFNKAFESKARLGIMSVLMVNDELSFNNMKELLSLTDGNLATHLRALEEANYISFKKVVALFLVPWTASLY